MSLWKHQPTPFKLHFLQESDKQLGISNRSLLSRNQNVGHHLFIEYHLSTYKYPLFKKADFECNPQLHRNRLKKTFFKVQPPISAVNFPNKISIPQVRATIRNNEYNKPLNPLNY